MPRLLTPQDIPRMIAIEAATQASPWSEEIFQTCFTSSCDCWGIEVDDVLVGFIIVSFNTLTEGHILNFAVDPPFQHQGFGKQLLAKVLQEAQLHHVSKLWLEVRRSNQRAISLYQQTGFLAISERKNYYALPEGREDALVFLIEL
ncbi:MAG: ribosomal protein S18-alanine N-acetyltransferase [Gammaproteobacteria bacterium]|nr:ribosomal protein S18-alanine N-acetyltransferase [Gammaproteobacteria bacterium]